MWNANTELAILMKALKGLPNNDALMRVLESNQRLLSTRPHSTGFFLPQHLKRPLTFSKIFQQPLQVWPWNQSSAGQQDNPRVCDIKTNKTTWVNSFYMASGTPMSGLFVFCFVFFFLLITQEKSHSLQGWALIKTWVLPPALPLAGYKTLKKRSTVHDTHLFIHNSLWFFTQCQAPCDILRK